CAFSCPDPLRSVLLCFLRSFSCRPPRTCSSSFFFFCASATTYIYTLSLHDALPISSTMDSSFSVNRSLVIQCTRLITFYDKTSRSEEHTSELQSRFDLVCRLLLEKKKRTH